MRHLERRIRNLESSYGRDSSGLLPNTPEWMAYWLAKLKRICDGLEERPKTEKIPFAVVRVFMQSDYGDDEED